MPRHFIPVVLLLLPLAGCDRALTVPNTFPEPLIEPLPLDVALVLTDEFANYHYREDIPGDTKWDIALGKANVALFDSVSRRLFRHTMRTASRPSGSAASAFDAIIEPSITAFEFSLPSQSATKQYSVWIRYTVSVYRPDGSLLTAWKVSAYGESDSAALRPARSMEQATMLALRDAATTIAVDFAAEARARGVVPEEPPDARTP